MMYSGSVMNLIGVLKSSGVHTELLLSRFWKTSPTVLCTLELILWTHRILKYPRDCNKPNGDNEMFEKNNNKRIIFCLPHRQ